MFLETLRFVLPAKTTFLQTIRPTVVLAGRPKLRVSKNFLSGDIFLYLLNIFATAVLKLKQKISKRIKFNFNYCKAPQLAGWFTAFNSKFLQIFRIEQAISKKGLRSQICKFFTKLEIQIFRKCSGVLQHCSWPLHIFNRSKNSAVLDFEELQCLRPRSRTSSCVLEDVLEPKDVLKDSTSATWYEKPNHWTHRRWKR